MKITRKYRPMTLAQFEAKFPNEDTCRAYLKHKRWPTDVCCPRCGSLKVYELPFKPWHWQCHDCSERGYRFSVLVGTIFENTNYPLTAWFKVIYLMLSSKKGISSLQIQRMMGMGSYHTALKMTHKIRAALGNRDFRKLVGFVEVDETFIGGKAKNKHKGKGGRGDFGGTGGTKKTVVIGAVQRKENVIARVINRIDSATLGGFIRQVVSHRVSPISTDEQSGYRRIGREFPHGVVYHGADQYVHGAIRTNTIDGFWSMIKRGVVGTFHKVSRKYLPLYVNEFEFRYNNRNNPDIFGAAIKAC